MSHHGPMGKNLSLEKVVEILQKRLCDKRFGNEYIPPASRKNWQRRKRVLEVVVMTWNGGYVMNGTSHTQGSDFTVIEFKLNSIAKYCVWYLDENDDEKFQKKNNKIMIFESKDSVNKFLSNKKIKYDILSLDIDDIITSVANATFNRTAVLDFINIVVDIAKTCNVEICEELMFSTVYNKLFHGENLSTINISNKIYHPVFSSEEMKVLKKHIENCILVIKNCIFY